jgi:hypothetical protein
VRLQLAGHVEITRLYHTVFAGLYQTLCIALCLSACIKLCQESTPASWLVCICTGRVCQLILCAALAVWHCCHRQALRMHTCVASSLLGKTGASCCAACCCGRRAFTSFKPTELQQDSLP